MRILNHGADTKFGGETKDLLFEAKRLHDFRNNYTNRRPAGLNDLEAMKSMNKFPAFLLHGTQDAWDESVRGVLRSWAGCLPSTRFWGWKEVHLGRFDDGLAVLVWLTDLLPGTKFIYLRRDRSEVIRSMKERPGWWKATHGEGLGLEKTVARQEENLGKFAAEHPDSVWCVDYEYLSDETFFVDLELNTGISVREEDWKREIDLRLR